MTENSCVETGVHFHLLLFAQGIAVPVSQQWKIANTHTAVLNLRFENTVTKIPKCLTAWWSSMLIALIVWHKGRVGNRDRKGRGGQSLETDRAVSGRNFRQTMEFESFLLDLASMVLHMLGVSMELLICLQRNFLDLSLAAKLIFPFLFSYTPPPFLLFSNPPCPSLSQVYWDHWQCGNGLPVSFQPAITGN